MLYKERGYKREILLIPGWGLDYRIVENLPLRYNLIIPYGFDFKIKKRLPILGHSLGGFFAYNFAMRHPELTEKLILVGIRKEYKKEEIYLMRENLIKNKKATLYRFYKNCFPKDEFLKFKKDFLAYYLKTDKRILLEGLEFFLKLKIETKFLKTIECVIVHGRNDKIAPIKEAISLAQRAKKEIVLGNFGHIPFLNCNFLEWIKAL